MDPVALAVAHKSISGDGGQHEVVLETDLYDIARQSAQEEGAGPRRQEGAAEAVNVDHGPSGKVKILLKCCIFEEHSNL